MKITASSIKWKEGMGLPNGVNHEKKGNKQPFGCFFTWFSDTQEKDTIDGIHDEGPRLLAPTGSDLRCCGQEGTVFAGYHYDLNFLTIHGRSRFPGLNIWLRTDQKVGVKVPVGCLLVQAGKQIEWLTAGECQAGMHEVIVTSRTIEAIKPASTQNRSLWRLSSIVSAVSHINSEYRHLHCLANKQLRGVFRASMGGLLGKAKTDVKNTATKVGSTVRWLI